jgi:hypothetical protein
MSFIYKTRKKKREDQVTDCQMIEKARKSCKTHWLTTRKEKKREM